MFIPNGFKFDNEAEKIAFIRRYSFATIVTCNDQIPLATQLPFVVKEEEGRLVLSAHFAAANEQVKYLEAAVSLVIFSEPHAYISPKHYDKVESVPTWDYMAVHAYGRASIIHEEDKKLEALEKMILFYEPGYMTQWALLSEKYKRGMIQGIVAFELVVTDLQGQKKLSQNKTEVERQRIITHLENSGDGVQEDLAGYIRDLSK